MFHLLYFLFKKNDKYLKKARLQRKARSVLARARPDLERIARAVDIAMGNFNPISPLQNC